MTPVTTATRRLRPLAHVTKNKHSSHLNSTRCILLCKEDTQSFCEHCCEEKKKRKSGRRRHLRVLSNASLQKTLSVASPHQSRHQQQTAGTGGMEQFLFLSTVHTKIKKFKSVRRRHLFFINTFLSSNFSHFRFALHRGRGSLGEGQGTKCKLKISCRKCYSFVTREISKEQNIILQSHTKVVLHFCTFYTVFTLFLAIFASSF